MKHWLALWVWAGGLLAMAASAQTVQVYSEFAELSDSGEVVAPANPREILSPAIPRNAFSSFQIAIQIPQGTKFQLFMGQNPAAALNVTLYRRAGGKLTPVSLPYFSDSTQVLWMDVWVDGAAPARRVKLEPQVYIEGDWVTYPMELRVSDALAPKGTAGSTKTPLEILRMYLCRGGRFPAPGGPELDVASLHARNAQQDVELAAVGSEALRQQLKTAAGGCDGKPPADPEAYLRVRDVFFSPPKKVQ